MSTLESLRAFRTRIEAILPSMGKELGISLTTGKGVYGENTFTLKIEGASIVGGKVVNKAAEALDMYLDTLGLTKSDLKKTFTLGGKTFRLVGYNPRASRRCMIIDEVGGKPGYVASLESVKRAMGK